MSKSDFINSMINHIIEQKERVIRDSKHNLTYNPIITLQTFDRNIEKWKNLSDDEYSEIINKRKIEQEKEELEEKNLQKSLAFLKLTKEQFLNMTDNEFEIFLKKFYLIKDRKEKLEKLNNGHTKKIFKKK